jgi:hypothetical protein
VEILRNIKVTASIVVHIPPHSLLKRYNTLWRKVHKDQDNVELSNECDLIKERLHTLGITAPEEGQMEMAFFSTSRKNIVAIVEERLREYRHDIKRRNEIQEQLQQNKVEIVFSNSSSEVEKSEEIPGYEQIEKKLKRCKQEIIDLEERMQSIDHALQQLFPEERQFIDEKYLLPERTDNEPIDLDLMCQLGVAKTKYYEIKNAAQAKIASSLGIL